MASYSVKKTLSLAVAGNRFLIADQGQQVVGVLIRRIPPGAAGAVELRFGQSSDGIPLLGSPESFEIDPCNPELEGVYYDVLTPVGGSMDVVVSYASASVSAGGV